MGDQRAPEGQQRTDLSRYRKPLIPGNRGWWWRVAWYLVSATVFQGALLGLAPSRCKAGLLRAFGARVGRGLVIKPGCRVKYPWLLALDDHVWLGEKVWIDNLCEIRIGSHVCISQGAYLGTGNHDWTDPEFRFFASAIQIEDGAWIGARSVLVPGARVGEMAVLCAGSVLLGEARPWTVYAGNPAKPVGPRRLAAASSG